MKFAVIGAGRTGQTMSAHLKSMGCQVSLYDRDKEKVRILLNNGIELCNALSVKVSVDVTSNIESCIEDADYIMIMTTSSGHAPICSLLKPHLASNQKIIIFNGNWGAVEFKAILGEDVEAKDLIVAETGAQLYLCDSIRVGVIDVFRVKSEVTLASIPSDRANIIVDDLKNVYPQMRAVENVIETSLNNSNPILHTPIALFNAARIDFGQDFKFYGDGASPSSIKYIERVDMERQLIAKALNINAVSVLDIINSFWPDKYNNLYDAIHMNRSYITSSAPKTFEHRYITEDMPYGIVPLFKLAKILTVKTPYIDNLVSTMSLLLYRDFVSEGPDFSGFNIGDYI